MLAEGIIVDVARAINDTAYARWSKDELIGHLNDGQRAIAIARPDAVSKRAILPLGKDAAQAIPSDGERFLRLIRNMGVDGAAPGGAITYADMDQIARGDPSWQVATPAATIKHYLHDPADPTRYYVWPPGVQSSYFAERIPYPAREPQDANSRTKCAFSPNGNYIAVTMVTTPRVMVYPFTNGRLGTPVEPTTIHGTYLTDVKWSPDGTLLAVGGVVSGGFNVRIYSFNGTTLTFVSGVSAGTGEVRGLSWHPTGKFLAIGAAADDFVYVYAVDSAGTFGAAWASPGVLPPGTVYSVSWSNDGAYLALAHEPVAASINVTVFPVSAGGFGTGVTTQIGASAIVAATGVWWNADASYLFVSSADVLPLTAVVWTGSAFGAKVTAAGLPAGGQGGPVRLSPDGAYVLQGYTGSGVRIVPWTGSAFGTALAPTGPLLAEGIYGAWWHPTQLWFAAISNNRPYLYIFGRAAWVELLYARHTVPVPLSTDTPAYAAATSAIDVPDVYRPALIAYMCHRALQKEDEAASLERAAGFMSLFGQMLNLKSEKENRVSPATKPPVVP